MSIALSRPSAWNAAVFLILPFAFAISTTAQTSSFEGRPIAALQFVPAQQPLDRRDMERVQLLHTGEPLHVSEVSETIERMFSTGRYHDIEVSVEAQGEGVLVRFTTENAVFVGHVGAEGQ